MIYLLFALILTFSAPVSALTENQQTVISQSCNTIRQTLETVQKNDSRIRFRLGNNYIKIRDRFMMNLNLRLVSNSFTATDFIDQHSGFQISYNEFHDRFVVYSQTLDELLSYDCQSDPDGFFTELVDVRTKRERVHESVQTLNNVISEHRASVLRLKGEL